MNIDTKKNGENSIIIWFSDLWKKFTNAGYEFHCYNWFIPAIFPIFAALIGVLLNPDSKAAYYGMALGFICQILYFSFFTLIINMAIMHKKNKFNAKNNDFVTSFVIALFIIVAYTPLSNNYYLNQKHYSKFFVGIIAIITLLFFILSIMLYSKYCESFNDNETGADIISKNKEREEATIEDNIEQFLAEDSNNEQ